MIKKRIIILLLMLLNTNCLVFAQPAKIQYLIPKDFIGGVIILYDQPDGVTPEVEADNTVKYKIPADGLLKVKGDVPEYISGYSYFYVDEKNNPTSIEYVQLAYYVRNPGDTTTKILNTLTEQERNSQIFAMSHRTVSFEVLKKDVILYVFSIGYPKDANLIHTKTDFRIGEINRQLNR